MVAPEKAEQLLGDVNKDNVFKLHMGSNISSLRQLSEAIDIMAEDTFRHHVNSSKNDFANWVKHSIGDAELAGSIENIRDRSALARKINQRVSYLEGRRSSNMISTQEFLTCGAMDFVLGAVIGFVIGMIISVML